MAPTSMRLLRKALPDPDSIRNETYETIRHLKELLARKRQLIVPESRQPDTAGLCNACKSIPWTTLHEISIERSERHFEHCTQDKRLIWLNVRPTAQLLASECKLCRALGKLLCTSPYPDAGPWSLVCSPENELPHLFSFLSRLLSTYPSLHFIPSNKLEYWRRDRLVHKGYLAVEGCGNSRGISRSVTFPRTISPNAVDFQFIGSIISACLASHDDCRTDQEHMKGLKVIDCMTYTILEAPPTCQYLALSYVWGTAPRRESTSFPRVVQDSITVTRALGYRYLWVDRYVSRIRPSCCICQIGH